MAAPKSESMPHYGTDLDLELDDAMVGELDPDLPMDYEPQFDLPLE